MTEKRFRLGADFDGFNDIYDNERTIGCERTIYATKMVKLLNELHEEKEMWKREHERCKDWLNSDKYDYELTLAFIKNKGYSLKDVLEYGKELKND